MTLAAEKEDDAERRLYDAWEYRKRIRATQKKFWRLIRVIFFIPQKFDRGLWKWIDKNGVDNFPGTIFSSGNSVHERHPPMVQAVMDAVTGLSPPTHLALVSEETVAYITPTLFQTVDRQFDKGYKACVLDEGGDVDTSPDGMIHQGLVVWDVDTLLRQGCLDGRIDPFFREDPQNVAYLNHHIDTQGSG